jgi:hypothetical protein
LQQNGRAAADDRIIPPNRCFRERWHGQYLPERARTYVQTVSAKSLDAGATCCSNSIAEFCSVQYL